MIWPAFTIPFFGRLAKHPTSNHLDSQFNQQKHDAYFALIKSIFGKYGLKEYLDNTNDDPISPMVHYIIIPPEKTSWISVGRGKAIAEIEVEPSFATEEYSGKKPKIRVINADFVIGGKKFMQIVLEFCEEYSKIFGEQWEIV